MNRFNRILYIICLACISSLGCKKNSTGGNTPPPVVDETITASIQGRIVDENGTPVNNATVSVGASTSNSDINGAFSFTGIQISKYFGKIKISKTGYFSVTKTIVTSTSGISFVAAELITRRSKGSFSGSGDASIAIANGVNINFHANSIVTAAGGAAYSGNITVYGAYLDPTDPGLYGRMPGDLRGIDSAGKSVGLQTFGMMVAELEGSSGEKLQIASGSTATITIPIPVSLQSGAPASIPLWYFNDSTGQWAQQGTAIDQGGIYTGTVSHFSYWNADISVPIIYFNGFVKDQDGHPLAYTRVAITDQATGETRTAYSSSDGSIYGGLISNSVNTLQVLDKCGNSLGSKNIGPFSTSTDLGTITVTVAATNSLTISGTAVNCSNAPVASGFVEVTLEGFKYEALITNGSFSVTVDRCNATADSAFLVLGDYASLIISPVQGFYVTTGTFSTGQLPVCGGSFSQFISFNIGGSGYAITVPYDSIALNHPQWIDAFTGDYGTSSYRDFGLYPFNINAAGVYDGINLRISVGSTTYFTRAAEPAQVTITQYGTAIGQDILGSFTGNIYSDTLNAATLLPVTGSLKLLRNY